MSRQPPSSVERSASLPYSDGGWRKMILQKLPLNGCGDQQQESRISQTRGKLNSGINFE